MKNKILNIIMYVLVKIFHFSFRYKHYNREVIEQEKNKNQFKTYVLSSWHQTIFTTLTSQTGTSFTMIISASKDGDFLAGLFKLFGHNPARGSSSKRGALALLEVIHTMKHGYPAAMAVDGPRGPAHIVKPGIVKMARETNSAIIPMSAYPQKSWCFSKSWDKFLLPKPFTKVAVVYGDPIYIPDSATGEDFDCIVRLVAEKTMEVELKAKEILGIN